MTIQPILPGRRRFLQGSTAALAAGGIAALPPTSAGAAPLGTGRTLDLKADFGAVGDGTTDDTPKIQAMFDALGDPAAGVRGATVEVPPGDYRITNTITVRRFAGVLIGAGVGDLPTYTRSEGRGSAFRWEGAAERPMFQVIDSRNISFLHLMFLGNDASPPSSGLDFHRETTADSIGTNSEITISDCHFGVWTWTVQGLRKHHLRRGIHFSYATPTAGNNDQFRIERCTFAGPPTKASQTPEAPNRGIHIEANQSIWGLIRSSTFSDMSEGIATTAQVTCVDVQFAGCNRDFGIRGTGPVQVEVLGYYSEDAAQLCKMHNHGSFTVRGGVVQLKSSRMGDTPGGVIDAFPSNSGQTINLDGVHFMATSSVTPRPTIRFGLDSTTGNSALGAGFHVRVVNCIGLHADQCEFTGSGMYGVSTTNPSRGCVEWQTRTDGNVAAKGGFHSFRNNLRGAATGVNDSATTTTLDTNIWQPPVSF